MVKKDYYSNGQLQSEYTFKDDEYHGLHRDWYENGQLKYEAIYREGNVYGLCRKWSKNGLLNSAKYWFNNDVCSEKEFKEKELNEIISQWNW